MNPDEPGGRSDPKLSPQERRVLELMGKIGHAKGVASELGISTRTVEHHLANARRKLGCDSTFQAIARFQELVAASNNSRPVPRMETSLVRRGQPRATSKRLFIGLGAALGLLAASWILFVIFRQQRTASPRPPQVVMEDILRLRAGSAGVATEAAARNRLGLVVELCEGASEAKWGPDEPRVVAYLNKVAPEVKGSFAWALVHRPDDAVRIIGNGHRLFYRSAEYSDWPAMLDEALKAPRLSETVELGRALCGAALVHVVTSKDYEGGYRAAKRALGIFHRNPGHLADEAEALRHMGMCCMGRQDERLELYREAEVIYKSTSNLRGQANVELSFAQAGAAGSAFTPAEIAQNLKYGLAALSSSRSIGNESLISDSRNEVIELELNNPTSDPQLINSERVALFSESEEVYYQSAEMADRFRCLVCCLRLDARAGNLGNEATDIETIYQPAKGYILHGKALAELGLYYLALCQKIHRTPKPQIAERVADKGQPHLLLYDELKSVASGLLSP